MKVISWADANCKKQTNLSTQVDFTVMQPRFILCGA